MKTLKITGIIGALAVIGALAMGAAGGGSRPADVPFERWIPMGEDAGLVLQSVVAQSGEDVAVQLYVMTNGQWRRARVENPIVVSGFDR